MTAFYDPEKSYEENYDQGPFGEFLETPPVIEMPIKQTELLGQLIDLPFGIPSGPLLNSKYVTAAWNWGYSLATYKTVRGNEYPCHPAPNIIGVLTRGDIRPGDTVEGILHKQIDVSLDGITNSFGVPSKSVDVWQEDVKKALGTMKAGNTLILSFMGTKKEGMTFEEYVSDFAQTAKKAKDTGAPIVEVNFSCPNVGKEGLICNDIETSRAILEAVSSELEKTPLLVKIGYINQQSQPHLEQLLNVIHEYADGVAAINTIQAKVVGEHGKQLLPGSPVRMWSGICGVSIRWAGLEMAERIMAYKQTHNWKDFVVLGVGGVVSPDDFFRYKALGVDAVQSATGAMWNPRLAHDIIKQHTSKEAHE